MTLHAKIDTQAAAYQAEIRAMAKAAQASINRSVGQHVRWQMERVAFSVAVYGVDNVQIEPPPTTEQEQVK